jgi:hypothetical protein
MIFPKEKLYVEQETCPLNGRRGRIRSGLLLDADVDQTVVPMAACNKTMRRQ